MESTVKQRLILFLQNEKISQRRFSEIVGVSSGYVNAIRKSIQPEVLSSISSHFPKLDIVWLLTGDGEMLKKDSPERAQNAGLNTGVMINGDNSNSPIDNRHFYSDSPDVLRAQIDLMDRWIKEKDAQIKEKDAQIKEKDAQIKELLSLLHK